MKLQTVTIVILAIILSSCAPVLQHSLIPTPSSTDVIAPILASTSTPTMTLTLLPTSTMTATVHPILETGLPPSPTIPPNATQAAQQEDIKNVIQAYFEIRYRLLSVSPPADIQQDVFGALVSSGDEAKDFLATETAKLAVERKWYELNKLRYARYEYSLEYTDIVFNASAQTATVSLLDNFEFVRERRIQSNPQNPSATRGGISHVIVLRNEQGQWKILSDTYWDSWWRQFRKPGLTTDEILQNISAKANSVKAHINLPLPIAAPETEFSCNFSTDDSSHSYERDDAVTYAQTHALPENYNLYYPSYDEDDQVLGGDCTNFVSQAIYEDGNASMSIPEPLPTRVTDGQLQWYLLNGMQRASAWNHVAPLYDFLISPAVWNEGPEGCKMTYDNDEQLAERLSQIQDGDIIQYDWDGIGGWDHSVIVVGRDENGIVQVASHSPNSQQLASVDENFMTKNA